MRRYNQTLDEIVSKLSPVETSWRDGFSETVEALLAVFPKRKHYTSEDIEALLDRDFKAGLTVLRLFSGLSKDEFELQLRTAGEGGPIGVTQYNRDSEAFINRLRVIGVLDKAASHVNTPVGWRDILIERLRSMRGTAIKGQKRGRLLEDRVEKVVRSVFDTLYDKRCRFVGASGESTEKADFAIPTRSSPRILLEAKAYGATGSKQTDILGDFERIFLQKRHDTTLLLVTDGETWINRANDLRKLIAMQNRGRITRIYTQKMFEDLRSDLTTLKREHAI